VTFTSSSAPWQRWNTPSPRVRNPPGRDGSRGSARNTAQRWHSPAAKLVALKGGPLRTLKPAVTPRFDQAQGGQGQCFVRRSASASPISWSPPEVHNGHHHYLVWVDTVEETIRESPDQSAAHSSSQNASSPWVFGDSFRRPPNLHEEVGTQARGLGFVEACRLYHLLLRFRKENNGLHFSFELASLRTSSADLAFTFPCLYA